VIGGTGNVGRHVVSQLSAAGVAFRMMTRTADPVGLPRGIELVRGDLTVPATLDACLNEIETVFWCGSHHPRPRRLRWHASRAARGGSCSSRLL